MAHGKPEKTNAMRALDARGIAYEVFTFDPAIHSAADVAAVVGMPSAQVYKTLVAVRPQGKPLLVMLGGDQELDLKRLARAVGERTLRMASHREAEALTGLQVGGISALALLERSFGVFIDLPAAGLSHILVSAGKRGVNLRLFSHFWDEATGYLYANKSDKAAMRAWLRTPHSRSLRNTTRTPARSSPTTTRTRPRSASGWRGRGTSETSTRAILP